MSTYQQGRDQEFLDSLDGKLNDFVSRYNANPSKTGRRTIFLFPGGMGSHLLRAGADYRQGPPFSYHTRWLDCSIAFGAATELQMQGDEDYQQQYVIANGCIDFLVLRPYAGFIQWCVDNWLDLFVFGWDWRRGIQETVDFFLGRFLTEFQNRVHGCAPDPLENCTLIGHSFGGMVVKLILNRANDPFVQKLQRAISVATQFYGYGGQVHRFFKGDPDLNWTEGANGAAAITEIVSTLPACYELLFLDGATYDSNQQALANDPHGYNLLNYPSMDAVNPGERADPYDPDPGPPTPGATGNVRYISNHGFCWPLLTKGKATYQNIAKPLDPAIAKKFYNIRGVQFKNGKVVNGTVVTQTWKRVSPTFDPVHDTDPLTDKLGPGDGTLPAWSTRLIGVPADHVITIKGDIEHMVMMNDSSVQNQIANLLRPSTRALRRMRSRAKTMKTKAASRAELNKFLDQLRRVTVARRLEPEQREKAIRRFIRGFSPDELQRFLARAYLDALKSPSQKIETAKKGRARKRVGRIGKKSR